MKLYDYDGGKRLLLILTQVVRIFRKAFDSLYDEKMLKKAEVDERVFLTAAMANIDTVFNEALDGNGLCLKGIYLTLYCQLQSLFQPAPSPCSDEAI
jgi:hypothetical protein